MPQIQPITVENGDNDQLFLPDGVDNNGVALYKKSDGVPMADNRLTVARTRTANGREKVTVKYTIPVPLTETVNGVTRTTIARTAYADVVFSFDPASTRNERLHTRNIVTGLLQNMLMEQLVGDLEKLY